MISNRLLDSNVDEFDRAVREALCDSIRSQTPSAHVRTAMLRAAAASRTRSPGRGFETSRHSETTSAVERMAVRLPRVRFVL